MGQRCIRVAQLSIFSLEMFGYVESRLLRCLSLSGILFSVLVYRFESLSELIGVLIDFTSKLSTSFV
jgi:hypothetical protein